jgi:hypothetical protein
MGRTPAVVRLEDQVRRVEVGGVDEDLPPAAEDAAALC